MNVNFLTTNNTHNGYGMTRDYLVKYLAREGIILDTEYKNQDVTFILHIPPAIASAKGKIKILYTMLEGDTVPESWKPHLAAASKIIVPTTFVQQSFKNAGFESTVVPLGFDQEVFRYVERKEKKPYTFLHYEAFQNRKGWQEVLDAWMLSLHEETFDARLILKTIKPWNEIPAEEVSQFTYNVEVISGKLPHHALFDILAEVDCFVFPSRGEGFSLPPLEAMATGLPTVITKGHSHMDYYNEDCMYGVEADIKIPATYSDWENQGYFVRCSATRLAEVLKHVYTHRDEAKAKGKLASEYVKRYSYEHTAKALAKIICDTQTL